MSNVEQQERLLERVSLFARELGDHAESRRNGRAVRRRLGHGYARVFDSFERDSGLFRQKERMSQAHHVVEHQPV